MACRYEYAMVVPMNFMPRRRRSPDTLSDKGEDVLPVS